MPIPVLPPGFKFGYGSKAAEMFGNPLGRDASGRNTFERGTEILRGTVSGVVADVKNPGGIIPGKPTGAIGEDTRSATGKFDAKPLVVYGSAILLVVFGLLMLTRSEGKVAVYLKKQNTYSEGE